MAYMRRPCYGPCEVGRQVFTLRTALVAAAVTLACAAMATSADAACDRDAGCIPVQALEPLADGTTIILEDYTAADTRKLRGSMALAGVQTMAQFIEMLKTLEGADRIQTRIDTVRRREVVDDYFDIIEASVETSLWACINGSRIVFIPPAATPTPTVELRTAPPSTLGPVVTPGITLPPATPAPMVTPPAPMPATPAPVIVPVTGDCPLPGSCGELRMRPEPITRIRPDRTEFELFGVPPSITTSEVGAAYPGVVPAHTPAGPVTVTKRYVSEPVADWDFGDGEGRMANAPYRVTYLYPRTSRGGAYDLNGLPAFQVTAEVLWRMEVTITYEWIERIPQDDSCSWDVSPPRRAGGPPIMEWVCVPQPGQVITRTHTVGPVEVDPALYGLPSEAGRVRTVRSRNVVVVQTSVVDGGR